jgi:hypothetical protein
MEKGKGLYAGIRLKKAVFVRKPKEGKESDRLFLKAFLPF